MLSVKTAEGKKVSIEQLTAAEAAIRSIALNNSMLLEHSYGTTREDVESVCELAHERWFELSRKGN